MTTQQLDMLTGKVTNLLTVYFNMVNAVQSSNKGGGGDQKQLLLHGLIEYMLTTEVKTAIFMRAIFRKFTAMLIEKIQEYRMGGLVQTNENLMKALDELELYIHDSAVARGGRGVCRLRQTGPHTGIMTKRSNLCKQESINYLNHYYLNYCNFTNSILQEEQSQNGKVAAAAALPEIVLLRRSDRLKRKREEEEDASEAEKEASEAEKEEASEAEKEDEEEEEEINE